MMKKTKAGAPARAPRTLIACFTMFFLLTTLLIPAAAGAGYQPSGATVAYEGQPLQWAQEPLLVQGHLVVPLQALAYSLGTPTSQDEDTGAITIRRGERILTMVPDQTGLTSNGQELSLPLPPLRIDGALYVPLRAIVEALGAEVAWDGDTRTVNILWPAVVEEVPPGEEVETLTLEVAIARAEGHNYNLRALQSTLEQLEELRARAFERIQQIRPEGPVGFLPDIMAKQALLNWVQTDIDLAMTARNVNISKETIAFSVENAYHQLSLQLQELEQKQRALDYNRRQLEMHQLKKNLGLSSDLNLFEREKEREQLQKQLAILETSLDSAFLELNTVMGVEPDRRYRLEHLELYEPLDRLNLDIHVRHMLDRDPYIWLQEQQIERARKELTLFTYTGQEAPYSVRELEVSKGRTELARLKQDLAEKIKERYNQLQQLEKQYEVMADSVEVLERQLEVIQLQLELGLVTAMDVEGAELGLDDLQQQMERLALQHRQLRTLVLQPYLMPDYLGR